MASKIRYRCVCGYGGEVRADWEATVCPACTRVWVKKMCCYENDGGRTFFVHSGNQPHMPRWGTFCKAANGTRRIVSERLPVRETAAEAQKDLDRYAKENGMVLAPVLSAACADGGNKSQGGKKQ